MSWAEILAHVELELPWVLLLLPAPILVWLLLPPYRERQESVRVPFLEDVSAVDYLDRPDVEGRFRVVYHMPALERAEMVRVKAYVEDEDVEVPTVSDLFAGANWLEREVFDMFGIRFAGHPNLRRILMAEDFDGYPCRRDFPWHGRIPIEDPMREKDFERGVAGEHSY